MAKSKFCTSESLPTPVLKVVNSGRDLQPELALHLHYEHGYGNIWTSAVVGNLSKATTVSGSS